MGKLIIFPTDTVYGIGCGIFDLDSIEKIYQIKKRTKDKPLACLCASLEQINEIAYVDDKATKLIEAFLPGPLTLILKSKESVIEKIGYETIGVRIPNSKIALKLLSKMGPMLTTSVNDSGLLPINKYEEIIEKYGNLVDEIYPPISNISCVASTVLYYINGEFKLLREGEISLTQIENVLNN